MTIRLGVLGLSDQSNEPAKSQYQLSALCSSSPQSAAKNAAHFSELIGHDVRPYHGPTYAIAADDSLDLVVVSIKAPARRDAVLPLLKKSRSVFVEWPLGKNIAETRELTAKAREKGVRTIVGLQAWQTPAVRKIREIIAAGSIGAVNNVTWSAVKRPAGLSTFCTPFVTPSYEFALDPTNGATLADIWIGHGLSMIIRAVGPLASLSATGVTTIPTVKVGVSPDDEAAKIVSATQPDQYGVNGVFAKSGALFSGTWCTRPLESKTTSPVLLWTISGTKGQIHVRIGSDAFCGEAPHVYPPEAIFLNEERVSLEEANAEFGGTAGRAWAEYARGEDGEYPTFEDALIVKQHVEALKRGVVEGRRMIASDM
ncbi:unnamed protein product [Peniophora sp. CBMAI 1063]|nr:unnamed protein product [Peniophora sp. CBMAI 1063]